VPLASPGGGEVEARARDAERLSGDPEPPVLETAQRIGESLPFLAQEIPGRYTQIREHDLGR
jgi:hypothetical protein